MVVNRSQAFVLVAVSALLASRSAAVAETVLVPFGSKTQWRYLDDGTDQGSAWHAPAFDDKAWRSGPASLGYGDPGIETTVSFGKDPQNKYITTYFRHRFVLAASNALQQLLFRIRSDDGIVVFLNGKEVLRNNLPDGEIGYKTTAVKALNDLDERLWHHFRVSASYLSPGENVLAVEVHQAQAVSTDLYLDLELRGYASDDELRPVVTAKARRLTEAFLKGHRIPEGQPIVDGFMDGGRRSTISPDDAVASAREVIVVDRTRDESLRRHLEFARSEPLKAMPPLDRAVVLAVYVDRIMTHWGGRGGCEPAANLLIAEYHGEPVLLGDISRLCGAGVCRHRATLYKLLADEAGLKVALVRGSIDTGQRPSEHDWNELYLQDGRRLVVDTSVLPPETRFPDIPKGEGKRYLDINNRPMYGRQPGESTQR